MMSNELQCRGSLMLGSGCGWCTKCKREKEGMRPMPTTKQPRPEIKLCKDCKHCQPKIHHHDQGGYLIVTENYLQAMCRHPNAISLVTGDAKELCDALRQTTGRCSASAMWWEPK